MLPDVYLEPSRTSTIEFFCKTRNSYVVDVQLGSKYASGFYQNKYENYNIQL